MSFLYVDIIELRIFNVMKNLVLLLVQFFISILLFAQVPLNVDIVFSSDPLCYGDSTGTANANAIGGVQPYNYQWDDPNNSTTANVTDLPSGTWTVVVTDDAGNTASDAVVLQDPDEIEIVMSAIDASCASCDGEASANATGGTGTFNYEWDNGQNGQTIANLCPEWYTVTVTDQNMCQEMDSVEVVSSGAGGFTIELTATPSDCDLNTGTAEVEMVGGDAPFTFQWDDPNNQTTQLAENLAAGTYTVVVTDSNGCEVSGSINVNSLDGPNVTVLTSSVLCNGGSSGSAFADVDGGTAPYTYQWDDVNNQTTQEAENLVAGVYEVVVTDSNGCETIAYGEVTEPTAITLNVTVTNSTCNEADGSATANANGGTGNYTYQWDINALNQTTATATDLAAGNYEVVVTDENGCVESATASVNDTGAPNITVIKDDVACFGDCDGSATVNVNNGTGPYTYQWNDPDNQTTASIVDLCADSYSVVVTDANDCSASANINVQQPDEIDVSISLVGISIAASNNDADGYQWIDCDLNEPIQGADESAYTPTENGSYAVIITEENCSDTSACFEINNVGLEEYNASPQVNVYPNPNNGVFYLDDIVEKTDFTVLDVQGKVVLTDQANIGKTKVDFSKLGRGIYYIKINTQTLKVLKH